MRKMDLFHLPCYILKGDEYIMSKELSKLLAFGGFVSAMTNGGYNESVDPKNDTEDEEETTNKEVKENERDRS